MLRRTAHGEREGEVLQDITSILLRGEGPFRELESFRMKGHKNHRLLLREESLCKTITSCVKLPMGQGDRLAFCMIAILYS